MFGLLLSLDRRRERARCVLESGPLERYLAVPFPDPGVHARRAPYAALDLETTGLDAARDEIIAIGLVHITDGVIELGSARQWRVFPSRAIPEESAVIHKITDDAAAVGRPIAEVLSELLPLLAGRVLIAHHARVELQFLRAACQRVYGGRFLIPFVDTQALARQRLERRNEVFAAKDLRLAELRRRYNLPRYRAHNALSDALAAAELFLAQLVEGNPENALPLKRFLQKQ